jgi:hypothetical protein
MVDHGFRWTTAILLALLLGACETSQQAAGSVPDQKTDGMREEQIRPSINTAPLPMNVPIR